MTFPQFEALITFLLCHDDPASPAQAHRAELEAFAAEQANLFGFKDLGEAYAGFPPSQKSS